MGKKGGKKDKAKKAGKNVSNEPDVPIEDVISAFKKECSSAKLPSVEYGAITSCIDAFQGRENASGPMSQMCVGERCSPAAVGCLGRALQVSKYKNMRSLCFWGAGIGDEGVRHLSEALKGLPSVKQIELRRCELTAQGCKYLAEAIMYTNRCQKNLAVINLEHNDIGPRGLAHLAAGFQRNQSVKKLSLGFCNLGPRSASSLGDIIKNALILKELNLESNNLRSRGVLGVCVGLGYTRSLEVLDLSCNQFGQQMDLEQEDGQALLMLSKVFQIVPTLKTIKTIGNEYGDRGAELFAEVLPRCPHIKKLTIPPSVSPEIFERIEKALSKNGGKGGAAKKGKKKGGKKKKK